jgi:hypothetical protein
VKSLKVCVEAINVVRLLHCFVLSGLFPAPQTSLLQFIKPAAYAVHSSHPVLKLFYDASLILALGVQKKTVQYDGNPNTFHSH